MKSRNYTKQVKPFELSLFTKEALFFIKCSNNTNMQCSNACFLSSDLWSSQRSEPQQLRIIDHQTSDQLKACSDILSCSRSKTIGSSLVFPTLTPVRAILLQAAIRRNNCSSFRIQPCISHFLPQTLSSLFRNLHRKVS